MCLSRVVNHLSHKVSPLYVGSFAPLALQLSKTKMIIRNVIWYGKNPSWFSPRRRSWLQFCLEYASGGPKRSIHGTPVNINVTNDSDKDNPAALSGSVVKRAQEICRLVSTNPKRVEAEMSIGSFLGVEVGEVSPLLVLEVLRKLSNAGLLALGFFRWAEKQKGFNYTEAIYNSLVDSLGKIRQFDTIWVLVGSMREKGLLSKDTFMLIIRRYAKAKKISEALETFEKMEMFGLRADTSNFNRFINDMTDSGQVEKAQLVFDRMKKKFPPDCKTYSTLLEGWGDKQNLSRLNEVYREMRQEGFQPDAVAYGTIINAFCKARKLEDAMERFHLMSESQSCKPTPHIYCVLINMLGSERRLDEALKLFQLSKDNGITPNAHLYNALVSCYCWSLRFGDAYQIMDEMRENGVGPNSRTYDIILHHLVKARRMREAFVIFQRMNDENDFGPTASTYDIIVRMFCKEDRFDLAILMWDEMKVSGVIPNMHMFSTLIYGLCRDKKFEEACRYFHYMVDLGICPSGQLFSILKQYLLNYGKKDLAFLLSKRLDEAKRTLIPC